MEDYLIRQATLKDIEFLVETIIEAEKSGTNILSYTTIFGLSEAEAKKYIEKMLEEEVDDCDLSVSGFLIAERKGQAVAALNAWVEGNSGIPSSIIKGNLLNYCLPRESVLMAKSMSHLFSELSMDLISGTLWFGSAYIKPEHRGNLLLVKLCQKHIRESIIHYSHIEEVYCPIFSNNIESIQNFRLLKFNMIKEYVSTSAEILNFLPSNKKVLMMKKIK